MQFNPLGFSPESYWVFPASAANIQPPLAGKLKRRNSYSRRIKPPYSYNELITRVIRASPEKTLTLRQIVESLKLEFPCFRGEYQGWRNSIRHNLSANECFTKVLRDHSKPNAKDNFWTINEDCRHCQLLRELKNSKNERLPKIARSKAGTEGPAQSQETAARSSEEVEVFSYMDSPKELIIDLGKDTEVDLNNNRIAATTPQNEDVGDPGNHTTLAFTGLTRPKATDHGSPMNNNSAIAVNNNVSKPDSDLCKTVVNTVNQDSNGWCKMTIGDINELNFTTANSETTRYYPQQPQGWSNLLPAYRRPYGEPGQYVYPCPVGRTPAYPDAMYQNRLCPPPYSMPNPAFMNLAAMNRRKELLQHLQVQQQQQVASPGDSYNDGLSGHTLSPVTEGSWGSPDQPSINAEYQQI